MSDLTDAIFNIVNFPDAIPNALIDDLATVLAAARRVANPVDELWWCKTHGRPIDVFEKITPKECLYVGRPGDCEPAPALIVLGITEDTG